MSKIRINLASGNVFEKNIVTCFKGNNGIYLILDNEANGQMGYPIICISRLNNNVVEKITDPGEWTAVKENLKTILSGTVLEYVGVPDNLTAQDDFFTPLTLPVASFDVLKAAYVPPVQAQVAPQTPVDPMPAPAPIEAPQNAPEPLVAPTISEPTVLNASPVLGTIEPMVSPAPAVTPLPVMPETPAPMPEPLPLTPPVEPQITPLATPETPMGAPNDVQALKESFIKSCENMFDALIKKFENK